MTDQKLKKLADRLEGEFYNDKTIRTLYATDASAYREMPQGVAFPRSVQDLKMLISTALELKTSLIPRTAGTSLAGQVVGKGIVVDVSRYMTDILELNTDENWVRVQPGVIRDELNIFLREYGLFFGPETSTANRAMMGGMIGNNSCGSNSVVYGSTREHLLAVKMLLADGQEAEFGPLSQEEYEAKVRGERCTSEIEKCIYQTIDRILKDPQNREEIIKEFPKPEITRRNTGYAIDLLLRTEPFTRGGEPFNMCKLIAGSEGTLGIITEAKLNTAPLPPPHKALVCIHFESLYESLEANLVALKYIPHASELIDQYILDCTKENIEQRKNRFFIQGEPKALLIVELAGTDEDDLDRTVKAMIHELKGQGFGYHYPVLKGNDMNRIWSLRKAGLGLLSNIPGDAKPVPVVEDTAVDVKDLPAYIREFNETLKKYDLYCVHYAHAGSGELHLRPIIDLKKASGQALYKTILEEVAHLVKKYKGSLSGEHGDGRLRGEFIPFMIGKRNYALLEEVKKSWDPEFIFNPGKIVQTPSMNTFLRYEPDQQVPSINTYFDFSRTKGILRAAELCNGSGDCRKTVLSGGTMCPSYMATKNEKDTTRARANILREMLTHSPKSNPFNHPEIYEVMDLCLSCKGCKSECPSNVDVAKLKAEFLQHYYDSNGIPFRARLVGNITRLNRISMLLPSLYNWFIRTGLVKHLLESVVGISYKRTLPALYKTTLKKWASRNQDLLSSKKEPESRKVMLFVDEFTDFNDVPVGLACIDLFTRLGYSVTIPSLEESGRTYLSKGMVKKAKQLAVKNIESLSSQMDEETMLIGLEPSAILTFRDEYPDLVDGSLKKKAFRIAGQCKTFEEFVADEIDSGNIRAESFTEQPSEILFHGHCHQKALSSQSYALKALSIPVNYQVKEIPSGCCGMAGSFGFEKEHYEISMNIGELALFPAVRNATTKTIIAAAGTSCRHQIRDGTGRIAWHPAEILRNALK